MPDLPLRAWADVDLDALAHNLRIFRAAVPPATGIVGVVKADAYGHGAVAVARFLRGQGVDVFAIASLEEAFELRDAGIAEPLWHLGVPLPEDAPHLVAAGAIATVTHLDLLRALAEAARNAGRPVPIHLKLDTGMGRRGTDLEETRLLWREALESGWLTVEALCTHFGTADVDIQFAGRQLEKFIAWRDQLAAEGFSAPLAHVAGGVAALRLPGACLDYIRPGLALYGATRVEPGPGADLRPVMAVRSRLCQVRDLPAGHDVGYAHACRLERPTRVGLVAAGYGDGWPWTLSGVGEALVRGVRVPYLGRVNMDLIQVDLNRVADAGVGEEVVLLGSQGEETIAVPEVASRAGVSEYTISTLLGRRVTRRYLAGGRVVADRGLDGRVRWLDAGIFEPGRGR